MLDNSFNVKITDFGFAKILLNDQKLYGECPVDLRLFRRQIALTFSLLSDLCGTPGYLAPETLKCSMWEKAPGYSKEVDM